MPANTAGEAEEDNEKKKPGHVATTSDTISSFESGALNSQSTNKHAEKKTIENNNGTIASISNTETLSMKDFLIQVFFNSVSRKNYDQSNMLHNQPDTNTLHPSSSRLVDAQHGETIDVNNSRTTHFRKTVLQFNIQKSFPILVVFVCIMTAMFAQSRKSKFFFMVMFLIEFIFHQLLGWLFLHKAKTENQRRIITISRCIMACSFAAVLQLYYGSDFPIWIFQTYKQQLFCQVFYHSNLISLLNCSMLSGFSLIFLYASHYVEITSTLEMCSLDSPLRMYPFENSIILKIREIGVLHMMVTTFSLLFSNIVVQQTEENKNQQVIIQKERLSNMEKVKFIGSLSHEARNPLNGIIAATQLLRHESEKVNRKFSKKTVSKSALDSSLDEELYSDESSSTSSDSGETARGFTQSSSDLINDIYKNANLLLNVFSTSLQLTSLELGTVQLNIRSFNILELVESMSSVFYTSAADQGVSIYTYYNFKKLPIYVMGDQVRISQILMNILSNAIKNARHPNGYAILSCDECSMDELNKFNLNIQNDEIYIRIDCKDNGKGLTDQKELFEKFKAFRWDESNDSVFDQYYMNTMQREYSEQMNTTSDLGLSISAKLIDKMGGKLFITSKSGYGSVLSIILPAKVGNAKDVTPLEQYGLNNSDDNYEKEEKIEDKLHLLEELCSEKEFAVTLIIDEDPITARKITLYLQNIVSGNKLATVIKHIPDMKLFHNVVDEVLISGKYSKLVLVFYDTIYHEDINRSLRSIRKKNLILVPMVKRGCQRHHSNQIIKPIKIHDLLSSLVAQLEKRRGNSDKSTRNSKHNRETNQQVAINSDEKALVVDDNGINRRVMQKMTQMIGFEHVDCASNGLEAFEMHKQNDYGIILMDL